MKKSIIIIIIALVLALILGVVLAWKKGAFRDPTIDVKQSAVKPSPFEKEIDFRDLSYVIDGTTFTLRNGVDDRAIAPGSAAKIHTQVFGNEAFADLNGDGKMDVVFLLTQNTGGSGTFYFVAAALSSPSGYVGTHAYFVGDRIAPQTTNIEGKTVLVNYADRPIDAPMSEAPSEGKTLRLALDASQTKFVQVER